MAVGLLAGRLFLAAVFAVAALAKLSDRAGWRRTVGDFRVPARVVAPVALLVPLAEFATAAALLPTASVRWAALGALALLGALSAAIAVQLARGHRPDCHCFGKLHSAPIGRSTLVRNGVLAAIAGFVAWGGWADAGRGVTDGLGGLSVPPWLSASTAVLVLAGLGLQGWLLLNLLRQNGRILLRLDALDAGRVTGPAVGTAPRPAPTAGLAIGTPAPDFSLRGVDGETLTLASLRAGHEPLLLLFTDPTCGPCLELLSEVARWQREWSPRLSIAVISRGDATANRASSEAHRVRNLLLQRDDEVARMYRCAGTPSAVLIGSDGRISSPVVGGADAIRSLVAQAVGERHATPAVPPAAPAGNGRPARDHRRASRPLAPAVGEPAPHLALPDLHGRMVDLSDLHDHEVLLLFWSPDCGFCQQLLDTVKAWERERRPDGRRLLLVSTGSAEANRALGLRSPVLLDPARTVMRAFGAHGTPMAVLIDATGAIGSALAAGVAQVRALAEADARQPVTTTGDARSDHRDGRV
jgi:peroxiredoxin